MADGQEASEKGAWKRLLPLQHTVKLKAQGGALDNVLAQSLAEDPILVARTYGTGRVLAFAGSTTNRWVVNEETRQQHSRFWRQMVVGLAHQEAAQGNVGVPPERRECTLATALG